MKCKYSQFNPKNRRGLSSVVGALLFVVLMVATFSVLGIALNTQTDIVSTARDVSDKGLKKQQEEFVITSILQPPGEDLEVELLNQGQNPAEIFTLVITDVDDVVGGFPTTTYNIPSSTSFLVPGDTVPTDIVSTTPIFLTLAAPASPDLEYEIKAISSLGTIKTLSILCDEFDCGPPPGAPAGASSLAAQLFLDGPNGINSKTSTIIMYVTNNGAQTFTDVKPLSGLGPDCDDMWQGNFISPPPEIDDVTPCFLDSPSPITLIPGQSAIFKWDGTIFGDVGDRAVFCNEASGIDEDLMVKTTGTECDDLNVINPNDCGGAVCNFGGEGGETIILIDDLLIRPSIFMVIPSPMGEALAADKVMFGINVVNPTNATIGVNKVILSVFAPGAQNNDKLFEAGPGGCDPEDLSSFTAPNGWSCPGENQAMWKKVGNPISLPPYSVETFMAKFETNGISSACCDIEGVLIQASVFTTFGSFGKGNYQTTMSVNKAPTMSLYMSPNVDSLADADRQANRQDITHNVTQNFNIILADTDSNPNTWLDTEARFIINVPRLWTGVNVTGTTGVINNGTSPSIEIFGDGSTQIIGITNELIGKCLSEPCPLGEAIASTISFEVLPPNKDFDRLYIMYVLADGEGMTDKGADSYLFSSGPLNEIVLQVNSNSTAP